MEEKLLLHCCCAHCAAHTIKHFRQAGYTVSAFWYNPNIHPYTEHEARKQSMHDLAATMQLPVIEPSGYDMPEYFRRVAGNESSRCLYCFEQRLSQTARYAKGNGFSAFSTTLLISPHQQHDVLREIGARVAQGNSIPFVYEDLRKRYSDSRKLTKPMELYRQQYCGCLYSEYERQMEIKERLEKHPD